jgi:hypothetical protein
MPASPSAKSHPAPGSVQARIMAKNKGGREVRKPKQAKAKTAEASDPVKPMSAVAKAGAARRSK